MGAGSVRRWVKHFTDGNVDITIQPHCDQEPPQLKVISRKLTCSSKKTKG
jgi:hypothetical protein